MGIIKSLEVIKFRGIKNMTFHLGERITLISGQNATHKTTLLGLLAQPFRFKEERTIYGKIFQAKFSDSFKFSKEFDKPKDHCYYVHFTNKDIFDKEKEMVKSYPRPPKDKSHIRLVVGETRNKYEGNLVLPVIYLTLKRVFPIGESDASISATLLDDEEITYFRKTYNRLMLVQDNIAIDSISSGSIKSTLAPHDASYDGLTISAGQDNLGQIIGSIISFRRLKTKLGDKYKGGLFLIDEIDATLHQLVKEQMLKWLYDEAESLNLQIVFTSHSLNLVKYFVDYRKNYNLKDQLKLLYISKPYGSLQCMENPIYSAIEADMCAQTMQIEIKKGKAIQAKIDVFCEDDEAKKFLDYLLGPELRKRVETHSLKVGREDLKRFSRIRTSVFSKSLFCLDGDEKKGAGNNVIILPGEDSPEKVFYNYILSLPDNHDFFVGLENNNKYTKQAFIKSAFVGDNWKREHWKSWFKKEQKNWGNKNGFYRLYQYWSNENKEKIAKFKKSFQRAHNMLAKKRRLPEISGHL